MLHGTCPIRPCFLPVDATVVFYGGHLEVRLLLPGLLLLVPAVLFVVARLGGVEVPHGEHDHVVGRHLGRLSAGHARHAQGELELAVLRGRGTHLRQLTGFIRKTNFIEKSILKLSY